MFFNSHRNDYVDTGGPVRYLDDKGLKRPLDAPKPQVIIMAVFVVIAAVIGAYLLYNILDQVQGSAARAQASVEENLSREVTYDIPGLASFAGLDNETIKQTLIDAGLTIYDNTSEEDAAAGNLSLIKLPADVSELEAAAFYAQGIANLDAADAALLLNGSWTLDVERGESLDMRVRYADFSSGGLEAAVVAGIASAGFDPATVDPENGSGVDEVGNTFQAGTVEANGTVYNWRVSAISLKEVYDVAGLPESAVYVGIRLTS